MTKSEARELLKGEGLRATAPRIAVLRTLAEADRPLSYRDVHRRLAEADWDLSTIYRNLVKLRDAGVAPVVSQVGGIDRYRLATRSSKSRHRHPHFLCDDCGRLARLPLGVVSSADTTWAASIARAMVELRGTCPECLEV